MESAEPKVLWTPTDERVERAAITRFARWVAGERGADVTGSYADLWQWSVDDVEGFQIHLGGQLGSEAAFGRKFRGLKVTADEAPDYAERVLVGYQKHRNAGESFANYVTRADEDWLHSLAPVTRRAAIVMEEVLV